MKKGEKRKRKLIEIAYGKFITKGYENTSVDEIIEEAGIAKGTYYYHFESKEQMLEEVINMMLEKGTQKAVDVLNSGASIPEKVVGIILSYRPDVNEITIQNALNHPENIVMHNKMNRQMIERMIPLLSEVTEEGIKAGVFDCDNIPERIRAILILSSSLFDEMDFTEKDVDVFIDTVEKILGAKAGTMRFIDNIIQR